MPKINQEEYEILKEKYNSKHGYRYAVRTRIGKDIKLTTEKPIKAKAGFWFTGGQGAFTFIDEDYLSFINHEDEEPYNIAELIEEYEEAMREAIEVLIKGVRNYLSNLGDAMQSVGESMERMFGDGSKAESFQKAIDVGDEGIKDNQERQLEEETEVKKDIEWAKAQIIFNGISPYKVEDDELVIETDMVIDFLNQLDEPETLSQEWVDDNKITGHAQSVEGISFGSFVPTDKLQNLLVPKQEKVKIPQFVADYIGNSHGSNKLLLRETFSAVIEKNFNEEYTPAEEWINNNFDLFALAVTTGEYEIEKPKKYRFEQNAFMEQDFKAYSYEEAEKMAEAEWERMFEKEGLFGNPEFVEEVEE